MNKKEYYGACEQANHELWNWYQKWGDRLGFSEAMDAIARLWMARYVKLALESQKKRKK